MLIFEESDVDWWLEHRRAAYLKTGADVVENVVEHFDSDVILRGKNHGASIGIDRTRLT